MISDRGDRGFAVFLKILCKRGMGGIRCTKLHYTFVYAHALHSFTYSVLFFQLSPLISYQYVLWFPSKVDWLCLIVCFVRRDMFQTNTWIRDHRNTLWLEHRQMKMLCQAEVKALPVNTSSRTCVFSLMVVMMIQLLSLNGRHQNHNNNKCRAGENNDFVLTEKFKYLMSGDCL